MNPARQYYEAMKEHCDKHGRGLFYYDIPIDGEVAILPPERPTVDFQNHLQLGDMKFLTSALTNENATKEMSTA